MAWPDSGTNEVVATIGTGRNHSTIAAWEADTRNNCVTGWGAGIYASACSPVGDCYDDADLAGTFYIGADTTNATHYRRLTVHAGQRHNGTNGSGVRIINSGDYSAAIGSALYAVVEWLIIGGTYTPGLAFYYQPVNAFGLIRNCVIVSTGDTGIGISGQGSGALSRVDNCVCHGQSGAGIGWAGITANNCSVVGMPYGFGPSACTNCIAILTGSYSFYSGASGDYNIAKDTTAPGAHSLQSKTNAHVKFANVTGGSEDLHIASDSVAVNAGTDLSAYFTIDIDGTTRPTGAGTWDIGADEYVAAGGGATPWLYVPRNSRVIGAFQ